MKYVLTCLAVGFVAVAVGGIGEILILVGATLLLAAYDSKILKKY